MGDDNCPVCGSQHYYDYTFSLSPIKEGKMCCECGYSDIRTYHEKNGNAIPKTLSEYCGIPCDLCAMVFETKGECPQGIEPCGGENHWKLLLERIESNGTAKHRQAERMW